MSIGIANVDSLDEAIIERIESSMANQGVSIQGESAWSSIAPVTGDFGPKSGRDPLIVFDLLSAEIDDTFEAFAFEAEYRFNLYDATINGAANIADALKALVGDGGPSNKTPSFGLNYWVPQILGVNASPMEVIGFGRDHNTEVLHRFVDFQIRVEEAI